MRRDLRALAGSGAVVLAICAGAAASAAQAAAPAAASQVADAAPRLRATTEEPRAFGYRTGDVVQRRVTVEAPAGLTLDDTALPPLGRHGTPLELRDLHWSSRRHLDGSHRYSIRLDYQVFQAPVEVRTFELPALRLAFKGRPHDDVVQVDPWPISVTPLTPLEPSARRGLGDFRPDAVAPLVETRGLRQRIAASGAAIALLLGYLAVVYVGLPWRRASGRPFQVALRAVRAAQASTGNAGTGAAADGAVRTAFQALHGALNRTAGAVLFERDLDRLLATQPRYAPLRTELIEFYARSRAEFFAATGAGAAADRSAALRWLGDLCRRLRDAERGSP